MVKTIKNPERYIKLLNKRIEALRFQLSRQMTMVSEYQGEIQVGWDSNTLDENTAVDSIELGNFNLGDTVAIIGKIIEVRQCYDKGKPESSIKFKRLYTKKVERY